jgi:hypothetical protein
MITKLIAYSHFFGVSQFLHETSMFLDTWNVESLDFGADGIDEVIISNRLARHFAFDFGVVY